MDPRIRITLKCHGSGTLVQALFKNTGNLSRPPQPFPRTVVPVLNHNGSFSYTQRPYLMMPPPSPFGPRSDNVFLSPNNAVMSGGGGFAGVSQQPFRFGGACGSSLGVRPEGFYEQRPIVLQPHTRPPAFQHQATSYTPGKRVCVH
jgi:hypothetical protein